MGRKVLRKGVAHYQSTTLEVARDLEEKLVSRLRADAISKVGAMASVLVNGFRGLKSCDHLIIDEALMNHFGAIVMALRLASAREVLLIGDVTNSILSQAEYFRICVGSTKSVGNGHEKSTFRNLLDESYAPNKVYSGIYLSKTRVRSLYYSNTKIPKDFPKTLYLTYTQVEKEFLIAQGFEKREGSHVFIIYEAQSMTSEATIIVRTMAKQKLNHGVPAIRRGGD
ncbi:hypothetical protein EVAR_16068_1 [Eumeta japonica]|uniref:(+)RNA virus helicase C-terminal domain-containing protein n=1 Tax=Eumeta variegata TaxID=151549 RepID=A0A4C1UJE8_EUMVA|nr:hypothetical protein EVAR_16068_1 [Eumeta japonica]